MSFDEIKRPIGMTEKDTEHTGMNKSVYGIRIVRIYVHKYNKYISIQTWYRDIFITSLDISVGIYVTSVRNSQIIT